jgi:Fe2+ or Zn2+ uptake regulation protein
MVTRIAAKAKFTLTGQRLDIYGLCEKCDRKAKPRQAIGKDRQRS